MGRDRGRAARGMRAGLAAAILLGLAGGVGSAAATPTCEAVNAGALNFNGRFNDNGAAGPVTNPLTGFIAGQLITYFLFPIPADGSIEDYLQYGTKAVPSIGNTDEAEGAIVVTPADLAQWNAGTAIVAGGDHAVGSVLNAVACGEATATALSPSANPSLAGQSVTYTATITAPASPYVASPLSESQVEFTSDGVDITGCSAVPVSNNQATCTVALPAGTHTVIALFNGQPNNRDPGVGPSTSSPVTANVTSPPAAAQTQASVVIDVGESVSVTPVTGSGGSGALAYSINPALPIGLSLNTSTGQITGSATATHAAATFTVTVTDTSAETASNTFNLTIDSALVASQSLASRTLTVGQASASFTPVTGSGGSGSLTYFISPTLPDGLSLNTASGQVTGSSTVTLTATSFTVTVHDGNTTATNSFTLTVDAQLGAAQAVATTSLTVGQAATPFTPVTGSGGTGALSYAITVGGALPSGLSLSGATGQITGTPTASLAATGYTVTVTDQSTPTAETASAGFSLTVAKGNQTVGFTSTAPTGATVGGATYTPSASSTASLTVTLGIDAGATGVCSINSGVVGFSHAGTCTIDATQAGDGNWNAAASQQQGFSVAKGTQTIHVTSTPPLHAVVGSTFTPAATADDGQPVTFAVDPASSGVCKLIDRGTSVAFTALGTCTLDFDQAGDADYLAAGEQQLGIDVDETPPPVPTLDLWLIAALTGLAGAGGAAMAQRRTTGARSAS